VGNVREPDVSIRLTLACMTASRNTIRYRHTLLRAGPLRLDGGSMFGLIPRTVWQRFAPTDDRGRITVSHNCLLLERLDDAPDGSNLPGRAPKLILLEGGTGDKLDDKSRELFALDGTTVLSALHAVNCRAEDIGLITATHLHFDHAGGFTRLCQPGEVPDWTGPGSSMGSAQHTRAVKRSFPNAVHVAQRREWEDALANRSVMTRTYFADHLEPLREVTKLIESPLPFAAGVIPDKSDMPALPHLLRELEVAPGLFAFMVPGHTWGQQAFRFTSAEGKPIVFVPDVMPTAWHVGQAFSLAYDVEPYTSSVSRNWLLKTAMEQQWTLLLDHEPAHPSFTVRANQSGWYDLVPA